MNYFFIHSTDILLRNVNFSGTQYVLFFKTAPIFKMFSKS